MATSDFGKAFAAARKAGLKTFEHNGKKYTTETREEAVKSPAAGRKQSDAITARKASPSEMETRRMVEKDENRRVANTLGRRSDIRAAQASERADINARLKKKYGGSDSQEPPRKADTGRTASARTAETADDWRAKRKMGAW